MDKRVSLLPLALILLACAMSQNTGPRRSTRVLLADEIEEYGVLTAAEAVELCRPQWLHTRSSPSQSPYSQNPDGSPPVVYLDGVRLGDVRELERIRSEMVERMEFLAPTDATNRFGTNHAGGAILVTTR